MAQITDPPVDERTPQPTDARRWIRRTVLVLVAAVACAVLAYGCSRGDTSADKSTDPVVVEQFPEPGARALRQTTVGAELAQGYDGRLTINGIAIPEDQMVGAVDPETTDPRDIEKYGIRPNNRNRVFFQPGPGKVIESFDNGEVKIALRYFRDRRDQGTGRLVNWSIFVN